MDLCHVFRSGQRIGKGDFLEASNEDLLELKTLVDIRIGEIADQLQKAKAKAATTREYSDSDWYQRANAAKRFHGQLSQQIQTELGARRRKQKDAKQQGKNWLPALLMAMEMVLPPEQREAILAKWREIR